MDPDTWSAVSLTNLHRVWPSSSFTNPPRRQPRVRYVLFSVAVTCLTFWADIAGANGAGWHSVLVQTGVYEPANGPPAHSPTYEASDVEEAVNWAIQNELEKRKQYEEDSNKQ